jgi:hypothetical protein
VAEWSTRANICGVELSHFPQKFLPKYFAKGKVTGTQTKCGVIVKDYYVSGVTDTKVSSWINQKYNEEIGLECESIVRYFDDTYNGLRFQDMNSSGIWRSVQVKIREIVVLPEEIKFLKFFWPIELMKYVKLKEESTASSETSVSIPSSSASSSSSSISLVNSNVSPPRKSQRISGQSPKHS